MSERSFPDFVPRDGLLCLNGWGGFTEQACRVIGETPKKYRILNMEPLSIRLGGRNRYLPQGWTCLVPKRAVKLLSVSAHDAMLAEAAK